MKIILTLILSLNLMSQTIIDDSCLVCGYFQTELNKCLVQKNKSEQKLLKEIRKLKLQLKRRVK